MQQDEVPQGLCRSPAVQSRAEPWEKEVHAGLATATWTLP